MKRFKDSIQPFHRCMLIARLTGYKADNPHAGYITRTTERAVYASFFSAESRRWMMTLNAFCRPLALARKVCEVVNVRDGGDFVYIGRAFGKFDESPLHNPFKLRKGASAQERVDCIEKFREYFDNYPDLQELALEYSGKKLGCWCSPLPCHGDVIAEHVNSHTHYPAVFFLHRVEGRPCCDRLEKVR